MAFTEVQKLSICKILGIDSITLQDRLDFYSTKITAAVETAVIDEITRWETSGVQFVKLRATESNKGVETDSENAKADIKKNIAVLLFLTDLTKSSNYLPRG